MLKAPKYIKEGVFLKLPKSLTKESVKYIFPKKRERRKRGRK